MTDLTIPAFLKRAKTPKTIDTPLSNIPSTPQDPSKASKPRKAKAPVRDNPPPKQAAPAKRAKSKVATAKKTKKPTPEAIRREMIVKKAPAKTAPAKMPIVKLSPEVLEAAKAGHGPVPPEVTAKSSAVFKKHRADLIALAKAKDVKGLREYQMNWDRVALQSFREGWILALTSK